MLNPIKRAFRSLELSVTFLWPTTKKKNKQTRPSSQIQYTIRRCKEEFLYFKIVIKICLEKKGFVFQLWKKLLGLNGLLENAAL